MSVKPEHVVKMSGGAEHLAWPGLLDLAHQNGLHEIDTELIQVPSAENGQVAIVKAIASFAEPDDSTVTHRTFSGIGDASPENVNRNIVPHIIRMAETRAKARALRDGVNAGVIEFEEDIPQPSQQPRSETPRAAQENKERTPGGATKKSADFLVALMVDNDGVEEAKAREMVYKMNQGRVSNGIKHYQGDEGRAG